MINIVWQGMIYCARASKLSRRVEPTWSIARESSYMAHECACCFRLQASLTHTMVSSGLLRVVPRFSCLPHATCIWRMSGHLAVPGLPYVLRQLLI